MGEKVGRLNKPKMANALLDKIHHHQFFLARITIR